MIAAELRGGNNSSLNEALRWIGSRVDDIYGSNVGRLEDVWIDPGTGVPRWLLVKEGRFGGRTTLIPFGDATAGAGHVWVPYEQEIVSSAPDIEPGAPLTHQVEAALRSHYATHVPVAISDSAPAGPQSTEPEGEGIPQVSTAPAGTGEHALPEPQLPPRPAPPIEGANASAPPVDGANASHANANSANDQPQASPHQQNSEPWQAAPQPAPSQQPVPGWQSWSQAQEQEMGSQADPERASEQAPGQEAQPQELSQGAPDAGPAESLSVLADSDSPHYIEIELSGGLKISGDLRSLKVFPHPPRSPER